VMQSDERSRYAQLGFKATIAKPFDPLDLAQEMAQALGWEL
jgi:CheY-like chemotaxis protein